MNTIVQYIVDGSSLEVTWIKITNATSDSFIMSIDSRVTGTGPIGATMSPMEVDLVGPGGAFGKLQLPEIKTKSSGTDVQVRDQLIQIIDMEAFKAFVKSLMQEEALVLKLENGQATIKALFTSAKITYGKEIKLKGMAGPKQVMLKTETNGKNFTNTLKSINPSPVEIDLGMMKSSIVNGKGEKLAEQTGKVYIMRGDTEYTASGTVTGAAAEGDAKVVGLSVEEDNWNNITIPFLEASLTLTDSFVALCKSG